MAGVSVIENLARFLTSSSYYSTERNRVRHTAFLPAEGSRAISVFRTGGLPEKDIWGIGNWVVQQSGRRMHGRADLTSQVVEAQGLSLDIDDVPPRHANIAGWPDEKLRRKEIAVELAENFTLVLCLPAGTVD